MRGLAGEYRDPAGAIQQDSFVDKVKDATSALPNSLATLADLNADVRYEASDYRDPAIATPQDKVQDKLAGGCVLEEVALHCHTAVCVAVSFRLLCRLIVVCHRVWHLKRAWCFLATLAFAL